MADLTFTVGDTAPSIYGALKNDDGSPFDLTGCTVRFQMRWLLDNRLFIDHSAVVVGTATAGNVRYDWVAGDLDQAGQFESRWKIIFSDNSTERTQPENTITVEAA